MIGYCKPDPQLYNQACEVAEVAPRSAFYIGDNLNKDAIGASHAGLRAVWANHAGADFPSGDAGNVRSLLDYTGYS